MKGLAGKAAIVTGGSNGIGRATVPRVGRTIGERRNCRPRCNGRSSRGSRTVGGGWPHRFVKADVSREDEIVRLVAATREAFGRVDILVNCAAAFIMRGVEATPAEWEEILRVNVVGYALCAKHVAPEMMKAGGGAIVNVCSISGYIAQLGYLTYNTTKGAVATMTRCLALELAPLNIRVNSVSPGTVWTESNARYLGRTRGYDRKAADAAPDIGGAHMLGRRADPFEVAEAIAFLASDSASFITAANLMVDGGYTAQ